MGKNWSIVLLWLIHCCLLLLILLLFLLTCFNFGVVVLRVMCVHWMWLNHLILIRLYARGIHVLIHWSPSHGCYSSYLLLFLEYGWLLSASTFNNRSSRESKLFVVASLTTLFALRGLPLSVAIETKVRRVHDLALHVCTWGWVVPWVYDVAIETILRAINTALPVVSDRLAVPMITSVVILNAWVLTVSILDINLLNVATASTVPTHLCSIWRLC